MKINKIILTVLILSMITLVFTGCGGGGSVTPPISDNTDDLEIPQPTEAVLQKIDLSVGGTIEVTDPESLINGVKLIIPPTSSNKDVKDSIATITISYIDDPYSLELPDNRGFLLPPVVINSDVILEVECILEIPYTEDNLSNMGLSSNENLKVYRYNYNSSSWEEVLTKKRSSRDMSDILEIIFRPEDIDSPYACTFLNSDPPSDLGLPQPGDLLYKLSNYKGIDGWLPGHVGIYVGEKHYDHDNNPDTEDKPYNVIEALLSGGVQRTYKNPISAFSGSATYMGARQPKSGILNPGQRKVIVAWAETIAELGLPYAIGQSFPGILFGMLQGNMVKGALGSYNCVGLAEKAYEIVGVNGGQGLVSDWDEGNLCNLALAECGPAYILTPAEQYNKTEPAEGYTVSGRVTDSQGKGIPGVTLNFELVSFNNYHNSFEVTTNSGGYWASDKLGQEWNVTPQKDGYTFEPSTLHEGWEKSDPSTWIVKENANDIDFTGLSDEPQNHAPLITSTAVISATKGQSYSYDVSATDSDGDILVYSLTTKPTGMTINSSTGLITWTPTAIGSFGVTVKASDGELFDTQSFIVTVEENGVYALRDIGPAGGYIFYDKGYYSSGWRYLEAAPVSTEWTEKRWGSYGTLIGGTKRDIGTGQSNTTIIVTWLNNNLDDTLGDVTYKTDRAAYLCDALVHGGYSDWFLPSEDENFLMYVNLHLQAVGGFADKIYWSSTENQACYALAHNFYADFLYNEEKYYAYRVRAVRAF